MSSTYSGVITNNPTSITIPSDGDGPGIHAADVNVALEGLMDKVMHTRGRFTPLTRFSMFKPIASIGTAGAGYTTSAAPPTQFTGAGGWWSLVTAAEPDPIVTGMMNWTQIGPIFQPSGVDAGESKGIIYMMPLTADLLNDGDTLVEVRINILTAGAAGGTAHSALPQSMPAIALTRMARDGSSAAVLLSTGNGWTTDGSATQAAYDTEHDIVQVPNQNNTIDHTSYIYTLYYLHEGGSNAKALGIAGGLKFTHTRNDV